ncbi:hypothetical protein DPX16_8424 [Anabarilius grahami]|uniref:Uncharacterized protein n=1 Tax=Anabarilius grahami TaxID=495550 RepID=A0A3N0Z3G7_ANAGA|nr:hypothetical protein DPX16_8424 [Anabarilius grahami]
MELRLGGIGEFESGEERKKAEKVGNSFPSQLQIAGANSEKREVSEGLKVKVSQRLLSLGQQLHLLGIIDLPGRILMLVPQTSSDFIFRLGNCNVSWYSIMVGALSGALNMKSEEERFVYELNVTDGDVVMSKASVLTALMSLFTLGEGD